MRKQTQSLHNLVRRPKQVSLSLGQEDHSQRSRAPQESRGHHELLPKAEMPKAGESLPGAGRPQPEEPRASGVKRVPAKGEFLPKAESPTEDTAQRDQTTGQDEPLPSPGTPSGPTAAAAAAEHLTSGDQGGKSGGPLPDESQATGAGAAPKEASKTERVDDSEDEKTSESTEEVPALQGTPLTTGARMWFPSQFPLTLQLVKHLQSGEFLPEPIQLSRLGFGRTRAVFSLPASALPNTPEEGVLKLCMVRQHHGKESEWGHTAAWLHLPT